VKKKWRLTLPFFFTIIAGASTLVQTITLRSAKLLQINNASIYIASQSHIWRLLPVPILTQVDQMVKEREYEGALALVESLTDFDEALKVTIHEYLYAYVNSSSCWLQAEKVAWIRKLLATHLFVMGQYERAMEHFAKLSNDPLEVIGLYQNFLPKPLRDKYDYPMEIPVLGTFSYLNRHLSLSSANLIFRISFSPPPSPN